VSDPVAPTRQRPSGVPGGPARTLGDVVEDCAELGVASAAEELGPLTKWRQLAKLLRQPLCAGSRGRSGEEEAPRFELHHDEDEVVPEPKVANLEEVARPDACGLVPEERRPTLALGAAYA
jgi:hypothetical protein